MNVLNTFVDSRIGGPQIRWLMVAKELVDHNINTEFLVPDAKGNFAERARKEGFQVHKAGYSPIAPLKQVLNNIRFTASTIRSIPQIIKLIKCRNIDVVHANVSINFHSAFAADNTSAALVWNFNDTMMPWPINRLSAIAAYHLADEIIVASNSVADHYFSDRPKNLQTVYPPVDTREYDPAIVSSIKKTELNIAPESVVVGTVGNLNPIKGHEYLLRAVPKVVDAIDVPLTILIVGARLNSRLNYYAKLQELASEYGSDTEVKFVGHRSDIPQILQLFDVFVLSSLAEGCPMVVLEAMAMKRPIVATEVGGIPEQIEDGKQGWLVPAKHPDRLATAIIDAITKPKEAERRGRNAREKVVEKFSLQHRVEMQADLYKTANRYSG